MKSEDYLAMPLALRWLGKLLFAHGFWRGFGFALIMSPILMLVLSFLWNGDIASWDEQYKSFIIGDVLLAGIVGLLAVLAVKPAESEYVASRNYWQKWGLIGVATSVIFIANDIRGGRMVFTQLFQPHLFYHHIVLITLFVCMIGGMGYVQYRRHPHHKIWFVIGLLFVGYVMLLLLDTVHPPVGMGP